MNKNYLKIAFRNLLKNKIYSSINIMGLALGIACSLIIVFFILDEFSYEDYHTKKDNIYRIHTDMLVGGNHFKMSATSFPMAKALKDEYSEIKDITRIVKYGNPLIKYKDNSFYESNFYWADSNLLEIFDYELIKGNKKEILNKPNSVVLTKSAAKKYFGNEDPINKIIVYEDNQDFIVSGVINDLPKNSIIDIDFIGSFSSLNTIASKELLESWHSFYPIFTFALLNDNTNTQILESKFPDFISKYMGDEILKVLGRDYKLSMIPLTDIYLFSDRDSEMGSVGDIKYEYIFLIIAFAILILACINFMNLTIAKASKRIKEIGVRKVFGAYKNQLRFQFLGESIFLSILTLPIAYLLIETFLPVFNSIANKDLSINLFNDLTIPFIIIGIILFVGIASGIYPAFVLARLNPSRAVKNEIKIGNSKSYLRQSLIVFQFSISIILLVGTGIILRQIDFMQNKNIGLNKSQTLVLEATDANIEKSYEVFENELLRNSSINNIAASTFMVGKGIIATPYRLEGGNEDQKWEITTLPVNTEFINTLEIEMLAGRSYNKKFSIDTVSSFIINEEAVSTFGFDSAIDAIGKKVIWLGLGQDYFGEIVGVAKNFNFSSLENKINPLVIIPHNLWPGEINYISINISTDNVEQSLSTIQKSWANVYNDIPFRYSFLSDDFNNLYQTEIQLRKIFEIFSFIAILIACLGLLGLVTFLSESRAKEIGIRKVLGASIGGVVNLITKEFVKLILIANVIALPISYLIMEYWLSNFAYRISFDYLLLAQVGLAVLVLSVLTIIWQAVKAAIANPVKSLRQD